MRISFGATVLPQGQLSCRYLTSKEVRSMLDDIGVHGTGVLQRVRYIRATQSVCPLPMAAAASRARAAWATGHPLWHALIPLVFAYFYQFVGCRGPHHHTYMASWTKGVVRVMRATNQCLPSPGMVRMECFGVNKIEPRVLFFQLCQGGALYCYRYTSISSMFVQTATSAISCDMPQL